MTEGTPGTLKTLLGELLRYLWAYTGTLSTLALFIGVMGMGLYHLVVKDEAQTYLPPGMVRAFTGVFNSAGPEPPRGIGALEAVPGGGQSCIHFEYNESGQPMRIVCVGNDGQVRLLPGSNVAEQRISYDPAGRVIAKRNYDAQGNPAPDAHGVAAREFTYDSSGRLINSVALGANGKKVVPRMPGYAEQQISYDSQGRPVEIRHLDGQGKDIATAAGEHRIRYRYDDAHGVAERMNSKDGRPVNNIHGIATERVHSTQDGLVTQKQWYAADGTRARHPQSGAASELCVISPSLQLRTTRQCAADGSMQEQGRQCTEHVLRTNQAQLPEWECFNGADGTPCLNPRLGYAEHAWEYNADGKLQREYFWDEQGNPAPCYEKRYSNSDTSCHEISLHTDGSTSIRRCDAEP
ncbi:MAG: hypothetical protein IKT79_02110 [Akkermansia sp.]|nr:hypothetical protein [Akkermansia sp.]